MSCLFAPGKKPRQELTRDAAVGELFAPAHGHAGRLVDVAPSLPRTMASTALSPSTVLPLAEQLPVLLSNFPQITTRAGLLLLQNNVSLITTEADNYSDLKPN